MKKNICFFLISIIAIYSFADDKSEDVSELSLSEKFKQANKELLEAITQKRIVFTGISPAISPRIYLGLVKVNQFENNRIREDIVFIHGFHLKALQVYGIGIKAIFSRIKEQDYIRV